MAPIDGIGELEPRNDKYIWTLHVLRNGKNAQAVTKFRMRALPVALISDGEGSFNWPPELLRIRNVAPPIPTVAAKKAPTFAPPFFVEAKSEKTKTE
jgi:hypothetical protein